MIGTKKFIVEKADGNALNLSHMSGYTYGDGDYGERWEQVRYVRQPLSGLPGMDDIVAFDSDEDAKIGMIAMMRGLLGDVFDPRDYQDRIAEPLGDVVIDFDELEADIRSGHRF